MKKRLTLYLFAFGLLPLMAQASLPAGKPLSPEEKQAIIEARRSSAAPRPLAQTLPDSWEDKKRQTVFRNARKSVVFIDAQPPEVLFKNRETGQFSTPQHGSGSGFVWDELGHVVTNYQVVTVTDQEGVPRTEAAALTVTLHNGKRYKAKVIGRSLAFDIAVLHVFAPLSDMKPLPMGTSRDLRIGQTVMALGNPFGLNHTLTTGIISSLDREILTTYGTPIQGVIQTDAPINPGNQGGPLLDLAGRLVAMNTEIVSTTGLNAGVGFAIPADTLNRIVPRLIEKEQQGWPELGFTLLRPDKALGIGVKQGLVVANVQAGSHAFDAGLRSWVFDQDATGKLKVKETGDLIIGLEGKPLLNELHLFVRMEMHPKGRPFLLDVQRDGKLIQVAINPWRKKKGRI